MFDHAWKAWLSENIQLGCSQESMIQAMIKAGFESAVASILVAQALGYSLSGNTNTQENLAIEPVNQPAGRLAKPTAYLYEPSLISTRNSITIDHHTVNVLARYKQPEVVIFSHVLSDEECDEIIKRSHSKLKRSTTINPLLGTEDVIERRTSEGTYFKRCEDDFVTNIDQRIAHLMNWPIENGEGLQILHYTVGGEYRPHFDYFPPEQQSSSSHIAKTRGGQRVATLIVYLSDVLEGGETIFPEMGLSVVPQKGGAVYFRYCNSQGNIDPLTLHGGAPVISGEKWIMTKWMRQYAYG